MYSNSTIRVILSAVIFIYVIGVTITLLVVFHCMQKCSPPPEDKREETVAINALFPQRFRDQHARSHASLINAVILNLFNFKRVFSVS